MFAEIKKISQRGLQAPNIVPAASCGEQTRVQFNKDSVIIKGRAFFIRSGGNGIQPDNAIGEDYGVISISGGEFSIESTGGGIQAETVLNISGGWDDSGFNWDVEGRQPKGGYRA